MNYLQRILTDFELHSVEGIRECFDKGVDPNAILEGKPLVYSLINMYSRGPAFKDCIRVFVEHGLMMEDKALLAVLLDDAVALEAVLAYDSQAVHRRYSFDGTFTPLFEVTLLHICAEYNHCSTAAVLVSHGATVNARAGVDENGFGGQTPIFHTVNQNANCCIDMLKLLLSIKADLELTVKGLIWGKGYDWETFIPSVNPLSYAMMGLLRQFQRKESNIYEVVALLLKSKYGMDYYPTNIPNKYLNS